MHPNVHSSIIYNSQNNDFLQFATTWVDSECIVAFVVQLLSHAHLFATPWTAARQTSLSFTISQSFLKFMSIESVMPSNHLILCCPLLLLPSIIPSIRVFSNGSSLWILCLLNKSNREKTNIVLHHFYVEAKN